jgi:hypothetical protein
MRLIVTVLTLPLLLSCGREFCIGPIGSSNCFSATSGGSSNPTTTGLTITVSPSLYQSGPVPRGTALTLTGQNASGAYLWTALTIQNSGGILSGTAGVNPGSYSGSTVTYTAPSAQGVTKVQVQDTSTGKITYLIFGTD